MAYLSGDAYRQAADLIAEHGVSGARRVARDRVNSLLADRDMEGSAQWAAVLDAVRELGSGKPDPGQRVN